MRRASPARRSIAALVLVCAIVAGTAPACLAAERKLLILVPRETPLNLIHVKNFELLIQAGATILPANPSFYTRPQNVEQVVDTVVARVLDHLSIPNQLAPRWAAEKE